MTIRFLKKSIAHHSKGLHRKLAGKGTWSQIPIIRASTVNNLTLNLPFGSLKVLPSLWSMSTFAIRMDLSLIHLDCSASTVRTYRCHYTVWRWVTTQYKDENILKLSFDILCTFNLARFEMKLGVWIIEIFFIWLLIYTKITQVIMA